MPPKVIARNADRTGGVLPVNAATRANATKASTIRLKLEVRRLPPSLTLSEFEETLGEEWKLGNGKIDWREYRQGKTRAAGAGKAPEQSRCYLHLISDAGVKEFERRFLDVVFQDKAGTHKNPELRNLQPTLCFAPNQRTPLQQAKHRTDNRQGTIDQDPEFIAFLESETKPITKPAALESTILDKENDRKEVKTTPLIEDLRERKANKAKAALAKAEKEKKSQATKSPTKDTSAVAEKDVGKGAAQKKIEQAKKDAAKVLNKQAAGKRQQQQTQPAQPQPQQPKASPSAKTKKAAPSPKQQSSVPATVPAPTTPVSPSPAAQRVPAGQRQRGNADGIKKMLQKDLGIKPKAVQADTASSASTAAPPTPTSTRAETITPASESASTPTPIVTAETKPSSPKAYLKHANPSQGMTEILIQQALAQYGEVASVTIDPRKGTAIAVFTQQETLKKALEAKRVPVANGAVEVLEFRDRASTGPSHRGGFRGGRPGRGGARGGGGGTQSGGQSAQAAGASTTAPAPSQ